MAYARATFQQLANLRFEEAKFLFQNKQLSGAYYLAGYAVECALKAIIAKQFHSNEIPDKALVNRVYTHDLAELLRLAGLESELDAARQTDPELVRKWSIAKNWSEQARYAICTEEQARTIIDAIGGVDGTGGLFQWLNARW